MEPLLLNRLKCCRTSHHRYQGDTVLSSSLSSPSSAPPPLNGGEVNARRRRPATSTQHKNVEHHLFTPATFFQLFNIQSLMSVQGRRSYLSMLYIMCLSHVMFIVIHCSVTFCNLQGRWCQLTFIFSDAAQLLC